MLHEVPAISNKCYMFFRASNHRANLECTAIAERRPAAKVVLQETLSKTFLQTGLNLRWFMIVPRRITTWLSWTLPLSVILVLSGCGKKEGDPVWTPDPALKNRLTEKTSLGKYQISLSKEFTSLPLSNEPGHQGFVFVSRDPFASLLVAIDSNQEVLDAAKENMGLYLKECSSVFASTDITIAIRGRTETGSIGGIPFWRLDWAGTANDQSPVNGRVYGAIDGTVVITICWETFGTDTKAPSRLMESIVATLKKQ